MRISDRRNCASRDPAPRRRPRVRGAACSSCGRLAQQVAAAAVGMAEPGDESRSDEWATPTKHRMPPPHSPPDDAPESPGAEQPGIKAAAHVAAGSEVTFAAPADLPDGAHESAPASPGSGLQSVSAAALALASSTGAAALIRPARLPPQSWETTAARSEGTKRVAADDPAIKTIYWTGRFGTTRGTEAEVLALARALCSNTHVQQVSIRYSPEAVTMASMSAMLSALKKCPTLISLDLGVESTTPHQRKVIRTVCIANACQRLAANDSDLEVIDWSGSNGFTDAEADSLALALHDNTHLRELKLDNNSELTDTGACSLLRAIRASRLTRVGLLATSVSKGTVSTEAAVSVSHHSFSVIIYRDIK